MKHGKWLTAAGVATLVAGAASAHGGGLNADGCHHNRKTGGYHCHRPSYSPPPPPPPALPGSAFGLTALPDAGSGKSTAARVAQGRFSSKWSWSSCEAARAAGAAPVFSWEDGYGLHLDPDGDGFACE